LHQHEALDENLYLENLGAEEPIWQSGKEDKMSNRYAILDGIDKRRNTNERD